MLIRTTDFYIPATAISYALLVDVCACESEVRALVVLAYGLRNSPHTFPPPHSYSYSYVRWQTISYATSVIGERNIVIAPSVQKVFCSKFGCLANNDKSNGNAEPSPKLLQVVTMFIALVVYAQFFILNLAGYFVHFASIACAESIECDSDINHGIKVTLQEGFAVLEEPLLA